MQKVIRNKKKFFTDFTDSLRILHQKYRNLEDKNKEVASKTKFTQEVEEKRQLKEQLRQECERVQKHHKEKLDEYENFKKIKEEQ